MIVKTIEDETTLSGQRIVSVFQARKIAQEQATKQLNTDIQCLRDYESACKGGTVSSEDFTRIMSKASASAQDYSKNIKEGTGSAQVYADKQKALQTTIQNTGTASKVAAVGVKALSIAGNMLAGMAISFAISKVIEGINYLVTASERAIEKTKELQEEISQIDSTYESNRSTLEGLKEEYDALASKIGENGAKASLSADEYERYRDITSEILGITPKLITGWDDEGRAISNKNGLLQQSIDLLDEEYQKSLRNNTTKANNEEIAKGIIAQKTEFDSKGDTSTYSGTRYELVYKDLQAYINEAVGKEVEYTYKNSGLTKKANSSDIAYAINEFVYGDSLYEATELDSAYGWLGSFQKRITSSEENFLQFIDSLKDEENPIYQWFTDEQIDELIRDADEYFQEVERIEAEEQQIYQQYKDQLNQNAQAVGDAYNGLGDNVKAGISNFVDSFDYSKIKKPEDFSNIATDLKDLVKQLSTDEELTSYFTNLYSPQGSDEPVEDYKARVKKAVSEISAYVEQNYPAIDLDFSGIEKGVDDLQLKYDTALSKFEAKANDLDLSQFFKNNIPIPADEIMANLQKQAKEAISKFEGDANDLDSSQYFRNNIPLPADEIMANLQKKYDEAVSRFEGKANDLDLAKFFKDNSINDESEIDYWNKVTEGAKSATEAAEMYNAAKNPSNKDSVWTAFTEEQSKSIDNFQSKVKTLGEALTAIRNGEDVGFTDLVQEFPELAGQSDNLEQTIINLINNALKELYELLGDGLPDDVKTDLRAIADSAISTKQTLKSLTDIISSLSSAHDLLTSTQDEISENGVVSLETLQKIASTYPSLEDAVANYMMGLISARDLISQLEKAYEDDEFSYRRTIVRKAQLDETELDNYINYLNTKVLNSEEYYESIGALDKNFIDYMADNYQVDLSRCKTWADAKNAIISQMSAKAEASLLGFKLDEIYDFENAQWVDGGQYKLSNMQYNSSSPEMTQSLSKFYSIIDNYEDGIKEFGKLAFASANDFTSNLLSSDKKNSSKSSNTVFDWIEVRLERLATKTKSFFEKVSDYVSNITNETNLGNAIKSTQAEINANKKAKQKYLAKANSINLSESWKKKVREGNYSIDELTDEAKIKAIQDYQNWWEKASKAAQNIATLTEQKKDYLSQQFESKYERQQRITDKYSTANQKIEDIISVKQAKGVKVVNSDYDNMNRNLKNQNKSLSTLNKMLREQQKQVSKGSDLWQEYQDKINSNSESIRNNTKAIAENNNAKFDMKYERQQRITDKYSTANQKIEDTISIKQAKGIKVVGSGYDEMNRNLKNQNKSLSTLNKMLREQQKQVSKGSDLWQEYQDKINSNSESIRNNTQAIAENNNAKFDIKLANYERTSGNYERKVSNKQAQIDLLEAQGKKVSTSYYKDMISNAGKQNTTLAKERNAIAKELKSVQYGSDRYDELTDKLRDINDQITSNKKSQAEWNATMRNIPMDRLNEYLDIAEAIASHTKTYIERLSYINGESTISAKQILSQKYTSETLGKQFGLGQSYRIQYEKALKEGRNQDADEYRKLYLQADSTYNEMLKTNEELERQARDITLYRNYEKDLEHIDDVKKALSSLSDIINDDALYNDDGSFSEQGIAKVALTIKNLEQARLSANDYKKEIDVLNRAYKNGEYNKDEYTEKLRELTDGYQSATSEVNQYTNAIKDLYKNQAQEELNALNELISKREECLQKKKDYYDYDKTIRNKTKDITAMQMQIEALNGVSTAEAKAQKALLEEQLSDLEEDLADTQADHIYQVQIDGLNEQKEILQDIYDTFIQSLNKCLGTEQEIISSATYLTNRSIEAVSELLGDIAKARGYDINYTNSSADIPHFADGGLVKSKGKDDGLAWLKAGEIVFSKDLSKALMNAVPQINDFSQKLQDFAPKYRNLSFEKAPTVSIGDINLQIQGNVDKNVMDDLKKYQKQITDSVLLNITKDLRKVGYKR